MRYLKKTVQELGFALTLFAAFWLGVVPAFAQDVAAPITDIDGQLGCQVPDDDSSTRGCPTFDNGDFDVDGSGITTIPYVDQDVTSGSAPNLLATNFSDGGTNAIITTTQETNFEAAYTHVSSNGSDHTYIDQDVTTTAAPTFATVNTGNGASEVHPYTEDEATQCASGKILESTGSGWACADDDGETDTTKIVPGGFVFRNVTGSVDVFASLFGSHISRTESKVCQEFVSAVDIHNLRCCPTVDPGVGATWTITLREDVTAGGCDSLADQTVTVTLSSGGACASYTGGAVTVQAGNGAAWELSYTSDPADGDIKCTFEQVAAS